MKPSWPEFPKAVTPDAEGIAEKKGGGQEVVEIDYEDQHLQNIALIKEVAVKYDEWLAAKGIAEEKRVEMLARRELVEGFARGELGIYL